MAPLQPGGLDGCVGFQYIANREKGRVGGGIASERRGGALFGEQNPSSWSTERVVRRFLIAIITIIRSPKRCRSIPASKRPGRKFSDKSQLEKWECTTRSVDHQPPPLLLARRLPAAPGLAIVAASKLSCDKCASRAKHVVDPDFCRTNRLFALCELGKRPCFQ